MIRFVASAAWIAASGGSGLRHESTSPKEELPDPRRGCPKIRDTFSGVLRGFTRHYIGCYRTI